MKSVIDSLLKLAHSKKLNDNGLFEKYLKIFYLDSNTSDLKDYSQEDLLNLCFSSFNFFLKKSEKQFKVRAYNPTISGDGFDSQFTILDVVNDDAPFLVDSIILLFDKMGIKVKNVIHPIFSSKRSQDGQLVDFLDFDPKNRNESVVQLHLSHISSLAELKNIEENLLVTLDTVHLVVDDWKKMIDIVDKAKDSLKNSLKNSRVEKLSNSKDSYLDLEEVNNFIDWIKDGSFIFIGSCEYDFAKNGQNLVAKEIVENNLGVFRSKNNDIKPRLVDYSAGDIDDLVKNPYLLEVLKSRYKSPIHRSVNVERVRIQKFDNQGEVIGEYRFLGLFTSSVYYQSADLIPIIRKKINKIVEDANFRPKGHSAKELVSVLESYPRDELFQIDHEDLLRISLGIVSMSGRSLVRFFPRSDKFKRFVSCLIFIPRDHFNTSIKEEIHNLLEGCYQGKVIGSYVQITESNLTRLHIIVRTDGVIPNVNSSEVEAKLLDITKSWIDDFKVEVDVNFNREDAKKIIASYHDAFSVSYTNRFSPRSAIYDIEFINKANATQNGLAFNLYHSDSVQDDVVEIKIYNIENKMQLSDMMPVLDSFGFNVILEHTYLISPKDGKDVWVHYFNVNLSKSKDKLTPEIIHNFEDTINKIYQGKNQIGHLNRMVVAANLGYRHISLLRAYSKYLYQAGFRYNQKYTADVLVKYRDIAKLMVELFEAKFNPSSKGGQTAISTISEQINKNLSLVSDSSEDLIIRRFVNIIDATTRTNFFQKDKDGNFKDYISFKFNSSKIHDLVLPVPYAEIFVFSTEVEGIHLRGAKVARGGLRWSDRHEDFRTEVLGLVKAQMTKNAVIVPSGSKGGFVVKVDTSKMNRDEILATGIKCYQTFLRGILDLTDNVIDGKIVHPQDVVRHDGDDPYLVVAADKGTATFSDIANGISAEYNFWLGDAFASGGSVGYDHKKMGITAKGGWISVRRHFSEMGIDIQSQDFTCVGIGDLSGDVFGNGMLLSKHTKLVAAFNHMHIFLDPNPDVEISFNERQRMFNLPRSTWMDYNKDLISSGGGIFERSAKSIKLSDEVKSILDIKNDELTPDELIRAILKAPVDLLWNGGIGTYVKSTEETNMDVGDRVNDVLRINGADLRCKVIGEGGNLGFTQKGRIEYSLNGGRINTDSIDNSAGVDCSDHEVNIKIALIQAMKSGKISLEERNKILESMTPEVEILVLEDNRMQTQTVTMSHAKGYSALGDYAHFLDRVERIGLLNRKVEFLPDQRQIDKRQSEKIGMTRPELCIMLSYSKMDIYNSIVNSDLVKDPYLEKTLLNYFPKILQEKFKDEILTHQLRNEIIATQITNMVVGRLGITLVSQISKDNGFEISDIVRNIIIASESFGLEEVWKKIESLNNKEVSVDIQIKMFAATTKLLERSVLWLLHNAKSKDIKSVIEAFKGSITKISDNLDSLLALDSREVYNKSFDYYKNNGVNLDLSKAVAAMGPLSSAYDIINVSNESGVAIDIVGQIYFEVGTRLYFKSLRHNVLQLNLDNYWQKVSARAVIEDLYNYQMKITKVVVAFAKTNNSNLALENWVKSEASLVERYDRFIEDFKSQVNPDLSIFIVALNRIKSLVG